MLTASSRPRTRSAPTPMSAARPAEANAAIRMERRNGIGARSRFTTPRSSAKPARQRRGHQRTEPGERHLAERQLPRPSGEHDQREPADREAGDRGVEQVPRRLRDQERQEDRDEEERTEHDHVEPLHPPDSRSCSGISRTLGANENVCVSAGPRLRLCSATAISTATSSSPSMRPGLVEVVEVDQRLHDADRDAREHRARERHHARDHRRGQRAHERVRSEREQILRGAAVVRGDQHHREGGQEPGDRPHRGGDHLRVDALHAREVGVLGRRLDRAPDQRAVEEPAERERDDRHDDEHRELRAGDPHAERRRSTCGRPRAGTAR